MTIQVRPDLDAKRAEASEHKHPLRMDEYERTELMEVLLKISSIAQEAFDVVDANALSEKDVFLILQLPDWCNYFTKAMEHQARRMAEGQRQRQRTSYRGTGM